MNLLNLLSCLSWDFHLPLPWAISAPRSGALGLGTGPGLTPLPLSGSQASGLGLDLHHRLSWASCVQTADCGTSRPP